MSLEINNYLKKAESERLYSEGLRLFERYGSVKYPNLLQRLKAGYFGSNRSDMEYHLRLLANDPDTVAKGDVEVEGKVPVIVVYDAPKMATPQPKKWTAEADAGFYDLNRKLRKAYQKRAQTSDSFHQCESDYERALVCQSLTEQSKIIKEYEARIEDYRKTGTMQTLDDLKQKDQFILADTYSELLKQQKVYKDRIRRLNLRITMLEGELEKKPNNRKRRELHNKQEKLSEYTHHQSLIKEAIANERENRRKQGVGKRA